MLKYFYLTYFNIVVLLIASKSYIKVIHQAVLPKRLDGDRLR